MGGRPKIKKFKQSDDKPESEGQDARTIVKEIDAKHKSKKKKKIDQVRESIKPVNAINYLHQWSTKDKNGEWKFKKTQHVWLLRNWRKVDAIKDEDFGLFVDYMRADRCKDKLVKECEQLIDKADDTLDSRVLERARNIVQSL